MENLIAGVVGALIALGLERVLDWLGERHKEKTDIQNTAAFLRGWFIETVSGLRKTSDKYNTAIIEWEEYLSRAAADPNTSLIFPELPYERITMPDIEEVVIRKAAYMTEQTYTGLLFLNRKLRLLDEQGKVMADALFNTAVSHLGREARIRFAKTVLDSFEFARNIILDAHAQAARVDLGKDASPMRIGGSRHSA